MLGNVFERTRQKNPRRKVTAQNTDSAIPGVELHRKSPVIVQRKLDGDLQRTRNIRGRLRLPVFPRDVVRCPFRHIVDCKLNVSRMADDGEFGTRRVGAYVTRYVNFEESTQAEMLAQNGGRCFEAATTRISAKVRNIRVDSLQDVHCH